MTFASYGQFWYPVLLITGTRIVEVNMTFLTERQLPSSVLLLMAASCFFFFLSWAYLRCSICSSSVSDDGKCRNTIAANF